MNSIMNESHLYIKINLQLFAADEKTEKATPKKRSDARKKGQVFQSREITSALVLILVFFTLKICGSFIYGEFSLLIKRTFEDYFTRKNLFTYNELTAVFTELILVTLKTCGPVFVVALVITVAVLYAQVGFLFTVETLGIKFEKINPINGFKRLFSPRSAVELLKSIIKITIVLYMAYSFIKGKTNTILNLINLQVSEIIVSIWDLMISLVLRLCLATVLLGIVDFGYQKWEYEKSLRMTKQEVKEEYKQTEGNPEIKSKIKQKQRQISLGRMLHEVPKADVVITNPTHFAVALKYDTSKADAPFVVAKGQDYIALRIKETAKENGVEIVENKTLARTLYETVDVGSVIPEELYQAVAEVLAFVYSLKRGSRVI